MSKPALPPPSPTHPGRLITRCPKVIHTAVVFSRACDTRAHPWTFALFAFTTFTEKRKIRTIFNPKLKTKTYEKVVERTGRTIQKYPSIAKFYQISYIKNKKKPNQMLRVDWEIKDLSAMETGHGVYFFRSNVRTLSERVTWEYYNLIREIECTNRQLKNDLNLRPIYHQKDERSDAHLLNLKTTMDKTRKILLTEFFGACLITLLIIAVYELNLILPGAWADTESTSASRHPNSI